MEKCGLVEVGLMPTNEYSMLGTDPLPLVRRCQGWWRFLALDHAYDGDVLN